MGVKKVRCKVEHMLVPCHRLWRLSSMRLVRYLTLESNVAMMIPAGFFSWTGQWRTWRHRPSVPKTPATTHRSSNGWMVFFEKEIAWGLWVSHLQNNSDRALERSKAYPHTSSFIALSTTSPVFVPCTNTTIRSFSTSYSLDSNAHLERAFFDFLKKELESTIPFYQHQLYSTARNMSRTVRRCSALVVVVAVLP